MRHTYIFGRVRRRAAGAFLFLAASVALADPIVPTMEQVSPAVVSVNATTRVTLTGTGFAGGAWVEIEPGGPLWKGKMPFQSGARGLALHGDTAVVLLAQPARLQTWDVTDPERPVQLASLPLPADPGPCAWVGDFLMLGLTSGSLLSVDVHAPGAPAVAGTISGTGPIVALAGSGTRLFLVRSGVGAEILEVTDPASPALRSAIPDPSVRGALAVEANRLYFTDAAGVQIWDVTEVSAPTWLGLVPVTQVFSIAVRGNRLIDTAIAPGAPGAAMRLVDVTDPAAPVVLVPRQSMVGSPLWWDASGLVAQLFWLDHGVATLMLLDLDTLAPRRMLAFTETGTSGWAPIPGFEPALGPMLGHQVPVPVFSWLAGPLVAGDRLYWPGWDALHIYDFSDPEQIAPMATFSNPSSGSTRAADESRAFVSYEQSVRVLDVTNPASPTFRGTCSIAYFNPLFAESGVAYGSGSTAAGDGWRACDARGAGAPTMVVAPTPEGSPLLRDGALMFGASTPQGFLVYDGSDPLRPAVIGSAQLPPEAFYLYEMVRVGDRVYATAGGDSSYLLTFDVTNPAAPACTGSLPLLYPIGQLRAGDGALYATNGEGALIGFDLSDPDHPRIASRMLSFGSPGGDCTFTTSGPWTVVGYSGSAEAPYFGVFRPNGTIRNFVRESDTRISFDVPPGWAVGPYHVRVMQPDGTSRAAFEGLTACVLQATEATLAPSPDGLHWRVTAASGLAAALRLPPIPTEAAVSVELEDGPDRIELFLASDGTARAARLKGADGEGLRRTFEALRAAGEIPWPPAGAGSFGDVDLSARARGRGHQPDLVYTLTAGHLLRASANRAGVDLVTVVRGAGVCTTAAELSYLDTLAELCATPEPAGALAGACRGSRRLPSLARDPVAARPVPFGR